MKAKESLKWFGILLLVFLLGISCMTMTALASGDIDLGQEGVLNLYFGENGTMKPTDAARDRSSRKSWPNW